MINNEIKLILTGDGTRWDQMLNRSGRNIKTFSDKTVAAFSRVGRTIDHVGNRIMGGPLATVASWAGITMASKSVVDFDARLARLAINADLTKKEMFELKQKLLDVGKQTYQGPDDLLAGIAQIVEQTGDFKYAISAIDTMGVVASATGSQMESIGAVTSNLNDKFGILKKELFGVFDILFTQGKSGSFELRHMAEHAERLFTAASSFGIKGVNGLREFGAFLQIAKRGSGKPDMTVTSTERVLADMIQNAKKIKQVTGFSIFDEGKSKKEGRAVFKDFGIIIREIIKRTKGDTTKLRMFFNEESIRSMDALANSYKKFGDFRELDEFVKKGGDGKEILKAMAFWTDQTEAKLTNFRTSMKQFANTNLAKPIEAFTKALDYLNNHPALTNTALWTLLGAFGLVTAGKVIRGGKEVYSIFKGGKSGKGGIGEGVPGLPGGFGAPIPVYVTNLTGSLGGGQVPGGTPGGGTKVLPVTLWGLIYALGLGVMEENTRHAYGKWRDLLKSEDKMANGGRRPPKIQVEIDLNASLDNIRMTANASSMDAMVNLNKNPLRSGQFRGALRRGNF